MQLPRQHSYLTPGLTCLEVDTLYMHSWLESRDTVHICFVSAAAAATATAAGLMC
jgi:hypothetical protein